MIPTLYWLFQFAFSPIDETCLVIDCTVVDDLVLSAVTC